MISLSSISKKFGQKFAVEKINFKAKEGEIIGFVGLNGAGKTTTMRLILGYLKPTNGQIKINDLNPIENRIEVLNKIGYLPENNPLYPEMKVAEYLSFIASLKNDPDYLEIVSQVGLDNVISTKIEELSRGYKQRVGLTAALIGNPEILILDEPTSGLDPLEQEKIKLMIKKEARHKTIIFSTHILSEVEDVANRIIIINHGQIVFDGKKPAGKGAVERLFKKLVKS